MSFVSQPHSTPSISTAINSLSRLRRLGASAQDLGNIDRAEPRTDQRPPSLERMLDILDRSSTILDVDRQI